MPPFIAVISDIHGNLDALNAVEQDFPVQERLTAWYLGDLFEPCPFPARSFNKLSALVSGENSLWLSGNHDRALSWFVNQENRADLKACYEGLQNLYKDCVKLQSRVLPVAFIEKAASQPTQQRVSCEDKIGIYLAHGFPDHDNIYSCQKYDLDNAPLRTLDHGQAILKIRDDYAPNTHLWIVSHSHRQAAWFYDGKQKIWQEWRAGFGTMLNGDPREQVPASEKPVTLLEAEIDFNKMHPDSLLILNPGSIGLPRDGIIIQGLNLQVAKYLQLELDGSRLKAKFRAVPYRFGDEGRELWSHQYPPELPSLLGLNGTVNTGKTENEQNEK